ncbi:MAG: hypothetical protein KAR36_08405, partial [Candidatus Latescibacteria bacterium]|nr:hypothetical protein [Candidatus Latescibacterota bacterium]
MKSQPGFNRKKTKIDHGDTEARTKGNPLSARSIGLVPFWFFPCLCGEIRFGAFVLNQSALSATCKSPKNEGTQLRSQRQNDYIIVIAEAILLEVFLVDTPFIE